MELVHKLNRKNILLPVLAAVMLVSLFSVSGCTRGIGIGDEAPDFNLKDINGNTVSLSGLKGSPVVLNFWATWCGPCLNEIPYLQAVNDEWQSKGLKFFAVNIGESPSRVSAFLESFGVSFPVLLDTANIVAGMYNITGTPTTYFIDENGIIQNRVIGAFPDKVTIDKYVKNLFPR